ncbi:MAG: flavodoxin domain-containing protein [Bacillota bacterium]|nr:flavodoxin domain-containing protein [Bacillota bacterium]
MHGIVIFGTNYGSTQKYARRVADRLGFECIDYHWADKDRLNKYDVIVYGGGLYAGRTVGLAKTLRKITDIDSKHIFIFTVGLADPLVEKNVQNIRESLKRQIPKNAYREDRIFHFRGGINYNSLNTKHKFMMATLNMILKRMPKEKQTDETKAMIDTYKGEVEFIDYNSIDPLCESVLGLNQE